MTPHNEDFNKTPLGLQSITESEFARSSFFIYSIVRIEFRQCRLPGFTGIKNLTMFHLSNKEGIAMSASPDVGKVHYFQLACKHDYTEEHLGDCMHRLTCKTCGYVEITDSSG